ncbi:ABC-type multidrug transport system, permease component [Desulfofundulus australicus DSM 11792]|uniref:Transport permease protein n=2 Tax=Desulfofundulus australicus TaxID=1566 RepID=A0A1M5A9S0_9FIRM|nr:ABC-type multidrug transport system, permease component [Desulfofundulus australicus DSM 11792]
MRVPATTGGVKVRCFLPPWYPIIWEEMIYWQSKFWLYLATYMLSPMLFLLSFGFGVGRRLQMIMPGGMSYLDFLVPGVVALALFNNGVTSVTVRMFYTRLHFQSFEAYRLAPVSNFSICLGYTLAGAMRGLLAGLIVLTMVFLLVPGLKLNWPFFGAMLLASLCFGTFGVLIGLCLRSFDDQALVSEFILVPVTFLSGTLIPVERLPGFLQHVVWFFPLTPAAELLRTTLTGNGFNWRLAAVLGGWCVVLFTLGWLRLKMLDG